jgi:16S rRNA (guanine527-N7)-methyltransferase
VLPANLLKRLASGATTLGLAPLTNEQLDKFSAYEDLLLAWNKRINLTSVTDPQAVVDRHFLDSLAVAAELDPSQPGTLLDIGSGGGFPGMVVALVRPNLNITLCEARAKRVAFLQNLAARLKVKVETVGERSDGPALGGRTFDTVVSRATLPLVEWQEHGRRFVRPGGRLIAMVAETQDVTPTQAGLAQPELRDYVLPDGVLHRLVVWRRVD